MVYSLKTVLPWRPKFELRKNIQNIKYIQLYTKLKNNKTNIGFWFGYSTGDERDPVRHPSDQILRLGETLHMQDPRATRPRARQLEGHQVSGRHVRVLLGYYTHTYLNLILCYVLSAWEPTDGCKGMWFFFFKYYFWVTKVLKLVEAGFKQYLQPPGKEASSNSETLGSFHWEHWLFLLGTYAVLPGNRQPSIQKCSHKERSIGNILLMTTLAGNIRHSHWEQLLFLVGTLNASCSWKERFIWSRSIPSYETLPNCTIALPTRLSSPILLVSRYVIHAHISVTCILFATSDFKVIPLCKILPIFKNVWGTMFIRCITFGRWYTVDVTG